MSMYVKKCPECRGINLFVNREKGEIICRDCGLVVEAGEVTFGFHKIVRIKTECRSRSRVDDGSGTSHRKRSRAAIQDTFSTVRQGGGAWGHGSPQPTCWRFTPAEITTTSWPRTSGRPRLASRIARPLLETPHQLAPLPSSKSPSCPSRAVLLS